MEVNNLRVPFTFNRLRTVIMTSLAFLILSAMLLIHVVTAKLTERDLINARIQSGRLLIEAISIIVSDQPLTRNPGSKNERWGKKFGRHMGSLLHMGEFSGILIKDLKGSTRFSLGQWGDQQPIQSNTIPKSGRAIRIDFSGRTWGLFWHAPEKVILSVPLWVRGRFVGSVTVFSDLKTLYQEIRASEPVIMAYIGINALILILFGIYLLSRTVVKPINRLVAVTEKVDDAIPTLQKEETPNNEIGRLSKSMNRMLRQIEANEQKLKENISSLEKANEEIKKAQDEMVKSEKMASVGRLATGVAHEIGNPLGIILGYIELLQRGDLTVMEREDFLKRMESEITRIHGIIRGLLDFSRPTAAEQHDTDAHEILEEVLAILSPQSLFEKIHIKRSLKAESVIIKLAQDSLKQVFLNIIINAADAMADAPINSEDAMKRTLTLESFNKEDFLIMRFSDTGCGINPDEIKRIFDPFFTTKEPGKGTGLGLSICYTMLDQAGGGIRAESEPGVGTTVILEMPLGNISKEEICCAGKISTGN
jgi:two-component system, NtrC family, sensor kinase